MSYLLTSLAVETQRFCKLNLAHVPHPKLHRRLRKQNLKVDQYRGVAPGLAHRAPGEQRRIEVAEIARHDVLTMHPTARKLRIAPSLRPSSLPGFPPGVDTVTVTENDGVIGLRDRVAIVAVAAGPRSKTELAATPITLARLSKSKSPTAPTRRPPISVILAVCPVVSTVVTSLVETGLADAKKTERGPETTDNDTVIVVIGTGTPTAIATGTVNETGDEGENQTASDLVEIDPSRATSASTLKHEVDE